MIEAVLPPRAAFFISMCHIMSSTYSVRGLWGRFLNEADLRRTYLRGRMHVLAGADARTCGCGCTYLQERLYEGAFFRNRLLERMQCFASERGKTHPLAYCLPGSRIGCLYILAHLLRRCTRLLMVVPSRHQSAMCHIMSYEDR